MIEWRYSTSVSSDRASALLAPSSIGEIANRIAGAMNVLCCHFENCGDNADFGRVVYCIRVSEDLFDVFFNSPYGYRGAYFQSLGRGIDANAAFIAAIAPKFMGSYEGDTLQDDIAWVRESLAAPSAKAWIAENGLHLCPKCEGELGHPTDAEPEIINGRWECGDLGHKNNGRKAPRLSKIRVFGGFLDFRRNEFIPWRKRHRAEEIHRWGWT